jgi:hypothetical protein
MKIKHISFSTLFIFVILLVAACGEKYYIETPNEDATGTRIKFINACSNCPNAIVKVGGKVISNVTMAFGGQFPVTGYTALPAGEVSFEFVRADSGQIIASGKLTGADNKYYTVLMNDTVPTPSVFFTEDPIYDAKEDTLARIRFVHGLSGKPKDTLEVVRKIDGKVIATDITYGTATKFDHLQQGNTPDSFFIRKAKATTAYPGLGNVIATWAKGRTYTLLTRGVSGKAAGTAQAPRLEFYTNR